MASHGPRRIALMLDLQWPYQRHAGIFLGVQKYAEQQNWHTVFDEFIADTLSARRRKTIPYDGIIARANRPLHREAKRLGIPVVNVWAGSPVRNRLPSVLFDFPAVGRQCAEHLLSRGLMRFVTLTPFKNYAQDLLIREFARIVGDAGYPCTVVKVPQDPWRDVLHWRRTEQLLERCVAAWKPPIGVYIADVGVGRMAAQLCRQRGLRIPAEVVLISGQNEMPLCERPSPSLTSVDLDFERIGYEAARLLHRMMDGDATASTPMILPPNGLVVRESTDFHAVQDELVAKALQFISANCHRPIGQHDVAKSVRSETRTLQNRFRKHLGRPIVSEIRRVRIERAKRALTQSKQRLSEIARDVGFGTAMRMYEVFRRELHVTPSKYREQYRFQNACR